MSDPRLVKTRSAAPLGRLLCLKGLVQLNARSKAILQVRQATLLQAAPPLGAVRGGWQRCPESGKLQLLAA